MSDADTIRDFILGRAIHRHDEPANEALATLSSLESALAAARGQVEMLNRQHHEMTQKALEMATRADAAREEVGRLREEREEARNLVEKALDGKHRHASLEALRALLSPKLPPTPEQQPQPPGEEARCAACHGGGIVPGAPNVTTCPECNGAGTFFHRPTQRAP